jgi:CO/xanthine dehydrogenase FAD-binding subunit
MGRYLRPIDLTDALAALAAGPVTILAGGTDFYPARVGKPITEDILDVSALRGLRGIVEQDDHVRIGAATTWSDVAAAPLPAYFDGLKLAAREVGGAQIQNTGTIAGNLCNASPAADGIPPLLSLDAAVELSSADGVRAVPLGEFVLGNRHTARKPRELVTAIRVPKPARAARATFLKLGARRYLVISIVMVAAVVEAERGKVAAARIAVGACSAAARRLPVLEAALAGQALEPGLGRIVEDGHLAELTPIDDVRGTAVYRRDAVRTLIARALDQLAAGQAA